MRAFTLALLLTATVLAGCLGDDPAASSGPLLAAAPLWDDPQNTPHPAYGFATLSSPAGDTPHWWQPIEAAGTPETITGLEHLTATEGVEKGAGIALFGRLAVVPGFGANTSVVDISDPAHPVVLSSFEPQPSPDASGELAPNTHRGAAIIAYPDGRLVTAISTSRIIDVWDITDPTDPRPLPYLTPTQGSHKVGVVPGTPILYNAASKGAAEYEASVPLLGGVAGSGNLDPSAGKGVTEIFDLSDPEDPVHVQDFPNGYSCHHVFFWNDPSQDKYRALCAGIEYTQIWDTADPLDPQVIVSVPVHHGVADGPSASASVVAFSHFAGLNQDGTVLLVGDEMGGGGIPPGCVGEARTPVGSASTPIGAVWFYDVSDEADPRVLGYYSPLNDPARKDPMTSCTAHHGRIVPAEGRDLLAMSFYGDGVILLDFTDPRLPVALDQFADGSDTWETWYYNGYLFTGDLARGMDVLRLV